jgi:recombination protein RecA
MSVSALRDFRSDFQWQTLQPIETVPSGIGPIDDAAGGLPRGCLTEIYGPASSGRSSLVVSILRQATALREENCALVDAEDVFDPLTAAAAGVKLQKLLWVRCNHSAEQALKATDLLIQGGGFGLVVMDLGDTPERTARRISLTSWFRLRRAIEHTSTVLVTVAAQSNAKTCASLQLECARQETQWSGVRGVSRILRGIASRVTSIQKRKSCSLVFMAKVI